MTGAAGVSAVAGGLSPELPHPVCTLENVQLLVGEGNAVHFVSSAWPAGPHPCRPQLPLLIEEEVLIHHLGLPPRGAEPSLQGQPGWGVLELLLLLLPQGLLH